MLTAEQLDRQDAVDNAIYDLLCTLAASYPGYTQTESVAWDIDLIGRVRDVIEEEFSEREIMSSQFFYPFPAP